ncbi:ImmA/IrrE family metallo-endopeptidase [Acidomonas methanolica]|uniref:ImmA/IrrE family metallo-endopeptidase n=1 Tax=Acidomonas methanolica TaxID=437 RepID=UPI00211A42B5|nr:ImmA/IrrE family metallo-endopeptidase [Acidomonas methanolica]MCQ9156355.1 ImmA/IrrE family metallo-endopeptidase [Acidomonas methanolica]
MDPDTAKLRRGLRAAGLSDQVIQAAWPSWWSDELANDASGRAELRFALARRLGVSPRGLLGERVEFVWNDEAKFKNLSAEDEAHQAALTSFGMTIGRLLVRATPRNGSLDGLDAFVIREAILAGQQYVDLGGLLALCWSVGIPVIHLRVFPLEAKSMHAMVVKVDERYAILLGRDARYPAPIAFTLAHELGHIILNHLIGAPALVDLKDPATVTHPDDQEKEADTFALSLLTGQPDPYITASTTDFNAPTLAAAVLRVGPQQGIDPAMLALCLAHRTGAWPQAMSALKFIYQRQGGPIWRDINAQAISQLEWGEIGQDSAEYLREVMGTDV